MNFTSGVCLALFGALIAPHALAQANYPARPIRVVVPFPPGGGADLAARVFGQKLSDVWGQPMVVENKPGGSGMIGAQTVAKATPDGYTLLLCSPAEVALNQNLYPRMTYNPERDLAAISLVATTPMALVAHPSLLANNVKELSALAKAKPGLLTYGTPGVGSSHHLSGELLNSIAKIELVHVSYKGAALALTDAVSGQIPLSITGLPPVMGYVKARRLKVLAITSGNRSAIVPDWPTIAESGFSGFDTSVWFGLLAPASTPQDLLSKVAREVARIAKLAEVRERLAVQGSESVGNTPEEFQTFLKAETARYARIIREAKVKLE